MDALLSGSFDDRIASYQVIDCRFDYEYNGGHIRGAVNVNTTHEIEEYFLGERAVKPAPSCSGDACKKSVLIFHCEFSAKRAPTLFVLFSSLFPLSILISSVLLLLFL